MCCILSSSKSSGLVCETVPMFPQVLSSTWERDVHICQSRDPFQEANMHTQLRRVRMQLSGHWSSDPQHWEWTVSIQPGSLRSGGPYAHIAEFHHYICRAWCTWSCLPYCSQIGIRSELWDKTKEPSDFTSSAIAPTVCSMGMVGSTLISGHIRNECAHRGSASPMCVIQVNVVNAVQGLLDPSRWTVNHLPWWWTGTKLSGQEYLAALSGAHKPVCEAQRISVADSMTIRTSTIYQWALPNCRTHLQCPSWCNRPCRQHRETERRTSVVWEGLMMGLNYARKQKQKLPWITLHQVQQHHRSLICPWIHILSLKLVLYWLCGWVV